LRVIHADPDFPQSLILGDPPLKRAVEAYMPARDR
jgi:hypothetical protein